MTVELPFFDYDQLSDNVRQRMRVALRDDPKLASAVTFGEGEAFVTKLVSAVSEETRRMILSYTAVAEEIISKADATEASQPSVSVE